MAAYAVAPLPALMAVKRVGETEFGNISDCAPAEGLNAAAEKWGLRHVQLGSSAAGLRHFYIGGELQMSVFDPTETSAARFAAMRCIALARRSY